MAKKKQTYAYFGEYLLETYDNLKLLQSTLKVGKSRYNHIYPKISFLIMINN